MADRLEMVVKGNRRPALAASVTNVNSPSTGFLVEEHRNACVELPDHWIPFYLVALQASGECARSYFENGKQSNYPLPSGNFTLTAPRELRRFRMESTGSQIMVSIQPAVLEELTAGSFRNPFELIKTWHGPDPVLETLVHRLQREVTAACPHGPLFGESLCTKVAEELVQRYAIGRVRLDQFKGGLSGAQLRRVQEYIDACLGLNLTANAIAGVAGLSKYHFGKAFKQSTGMTLHGYVLARRIRRSQELLTKSKLPLAAIAETVGFSNQSHFTTVFSTRTGISPRQCRESVHKRLVL